MRGAQRFSLPFSYFPIFFFFFFHSWVSAQLSSNQTTTMINLSELLQNSSASSPWRNINKSNPCSWKGVSCSPDNSFITHLSLSNFGLSSPDVLQVLCQIDSLESLDVSNNHFNSIPDVFITACGQIAGMKLLNFSKNRLAGSLPTFHGFVGLQFLDLSYNLLTGSIDLQFDGLVGLRSLTLSFNSFTGSVPTHLGQSMALEQLVLFQNSFNGRFPQELMAYKNLTLVDLSVNQLSGSLPNTIEELPKLETLILSSNKFSGPIPNTLWNITTLSRFAANQNSFNGSIPSGISSSLRNLDLSYNSLRGSIPSELLSHSNLQTLDLSYNLLEGSIPANISANLVRLRLGSNTLNGTIPSATLVTLENLIYMELDNNSLSGSIPSELGFCKSLALLNLAKNNLTGNLPVELGNLTHLQVMKLQFNKLVGEIPIQLAGLQRLSTLNMSWNSLNGSIPNYISSLQNLTNLNLRENNLSGSIPSSIGSLNSLLELQLGKNQLSGTIPSMPRNLQIGLNLSSNLFKGPIPNTLSQLTGLEVLDLSNNKFSGQIPDFLTKMDALTQLVLSDNQLSGVLPKFGTWVTVSISGNKVTVNDTSHPSPESPKKRKSVTWAVPLGVAAAVITGGVIVAIALLVSRRFYRVNDDELHLGEDREDPPLPQVIYGNLLTANGIHRSNIDFIRAMEAVANPMNVMLKTRFSTYYKSNMPSGTSYFIKKIDWSDKIFQMGSREKFGQELEVIGKLNNSNVMVPLAYVLTTDCAYLFYEFAQKGTLFDVLHGSLGDSLDWVSRYSIAVGVAQGLDFLHGCTSGPIILLDLSSKSIMLKSIKEPQIGDIELCKVIDPSKSTGSLSAIAGSVGYIPPEYAYTMRVTTAANVYSFGVVLLELLTGKTAVSDGIELAKWASSKSLNQDKWDHILDFNITRASVAVRSQMLAILKVALACVSVSPEARPKMKSVLRMLVNAR